MATNISHKHLLDARDKIASIRNRIAAMRQKGEAATEKIVRSAEVSGTAFAMGVVQGRTGGIEIVGVPLELLVGGAGLVAGHLGAAGKMSDHLINVGDGALAAWAATMGRGVGVTWRSKTVNGGAAKPQAAVKGEERRQVGPGDIDENELGAAARAVARAVAG